MNPLTDDERGSISHIKKLVDYWDKVFAGEALSSEDFRADSHSWIWKECVDEIRRVLTVVPDSYWSTPEYKALLEAEAARHDAIDAMFDAAYEAHGKIDPEFAG